MKIKVKGLKIEVKEFEFEDVDREKILEGYRKAIRQISVLVSKETSLEKIAQELKLLQEHPNI